MQRDICCWLAVGGMLAGWQQDLQYLVYRSTAGRWAARRRSVFAGRLVTIKGTVVRASNIRPLVTDLDFLCSKCGEVATERLVDGIYQPPTSCRGDGCRGRTFLPQRKSAKTVDWQKLRIQVSSHTHSSPRPGGGKHATSVL